MSLPKYFQDQGFVLKRYNYSEADRLITVFTRNHGKLTAIAKGVRKPTSKKAPHIETFTHVDLYFVKGHNLPLITQAQTITKFSHLEHHLDTTRQAYHLAEIIDRLLQDEQPYPKIFDDLISLFNCLDLSFKITNFHQQKLIASFQFNLLTQLGFGTPKYTDNNSLDEFIESILDRHLTARTHLK